MVNDSGAYIYERASTSVVCRLSASKLEMLGLSPGFRKPWPPMMKAPAPVRWFGNPGADGSAAAMRSSLRAVSFEALSALQKMAAKTEVPLFFLCHHAILYRLKLPSSHSSHSQIESHLNS